MKPVRLVFIGVAALVVTLLAAAAVAFNSSFQTWAVGKTLAGHPEWGASIGKVDAGIKRVELRNVRVQRAGATVTLPLVEAEVSTLAAAFGERVFVDRLTAKGWTVDLSTGASAAPGNAVAADPVHAAEQTVAGLFARLKLPFDLAVTDLRLEGDVVLPENRGRAKVSVTGGGLTVPGDGKFDIRGDAELADSNINALEVRGQVSVHMDTARTFSRFDATVDAIARGAQVPNGVKLAAKLSAARTEAGEAYSVAVATGERQLLSLEATLPRAARQLEGRWQLNVRDADLAPFALGRPLPAFSALGEGRFDSDASLSSVRGQGRLEASAERLSQLAPELAAVGAIQLAGEFDLAQRGSRTVVDQLNLVLRSREQPVASIRSLQAFSFDLKSRALVAADVTRELFAFDVQGVPLAWIQPLLPATELTGGNVRGELVATTRSGGVHVRSRSPLTIAELTITREGKAWLSDADVSLHAAADYAPQGWQAEVSALTVKAGEEILFTADAKAGQLAGARQPVKATGKIAAHLAALRGQPIARVARSLTKGEGSIEFAASLGETREIQAAIALHGLAAEPAVGAGKLPSLSTSLRADISADGKVALNLPIQLESDRGKSDLTIAGSFAPGNDGLTIDAQLTSANFVVDDAKTLAALIASSESNDDKTPAATPPWTGLNGTLVLALQRVIYSNAVEASDVHGTLRIVDGGVKLEGLRTGLGEAGRATLEGAVTFDAHLAQPYGLSATLAMHDFDPGPLFRAINPNQSPTVEGRFHLTGRIEGRTAALADLPWHAAGNFELTSRGGVFRGLPVNVANLTENTGTIAGWIASAGSAISELTGRRDGNESVSRAQAVSELAKKLNAIPYDQLNFSVSRTPALDTTIDNFTLISPEVRLTGRGGTTHQQGVPLLDDRLNVEFKLRARDQVANLLRRIGRLEEGVDELGYSACTLPFKVNGSLSRPQTGELNRALVAIALEKAGVADKAADFIDRIRGK